MPAHLVHRINASLAAEQAQRGARTPGASVTPMTPMPSTGRRRRPRLLFGIAGAAAAAVLVAAVSSNVLHSGQDSSTASSAGAARTAGAAERGADAQRSAAGKAPAAASGASTAALVQLGRSGTRYTRADFLAQALRLRRAPAPQAALSSGLSLAGTPSGFKDCLTAIGAENAQVVRADVAFYEGRPAMVIVATTNGVPVAYAVGPGCSHADPAVLHPATPLS